MRQVIIVSNRLPISVKKEDGQLSFSPSVGGLATGLSSYVNRRSNSWIGWPGIASEELNEADKEVIVAELSKHNCIPVFLSRAQIDDFYNGYSNQVLWQLFHNLRRSDLPPEKYQRFWQAYRQVNQKYAEAVLNSSETGGHIWIHDYQLLLVPEMIRSERPDVIIGFFLHIPWPDPNKFFALPEAKRLLKGVIGADVAGFHTPSYVSNFLESAKLAGWLQTGPNELTDHDRSVRVDDFPMGIDYEKYASAGRSSTVKDAVKRYRKLYKKRQIIVSVDRLDPSKGLSEKLKAYSQLLERYPKIKGKVVFAMVVAPSRMEVPAYKRLSKRLQIQVDEINEKFGKKNWQPIHYMNVTQPFDEVTALFQVADVAFITPLKDGMNLAAKEFVASRHHGGVLILSETAGAAEELKDALLVNPSKPETMVEALHTGLTMHRRELRRRLRRMQQELSTNTVQDWAKDFVTTLNKPVPGVGARTIRQVIKRQIISDFRLSKKRLLLLDYDGSLVPFNVDYSEATPPKTLINLMEKLCADINNDVVVISGRSSEDLENWFGHLPISLVAEHGATYKKSGNTSWKTIEKVDTSWKQELQPILEKYSLLTPGAKLEVKPHSLVWHYRVASPYHANKYAVIMKRTLKPLMKNYGLEMMQGNKVLEIKSSQVNKGAAAMRWLKQSYNFILAIGDDATDENLFSVLPVNSVKTKVYSIKVGRGRSLAEYRVTSYKDVLSLLKNLV